MRGTTIFLLGLAASSSALADVAQCPVHEPGARYPWQSNTIMEGDHYAWLILDVDRGGYPYRCRVGENNYVDPEQRFFLCKNYSERWRGPPAAASEPESRRLMRYSLVAGYDHLIADKKARRLWFRDHPEQLPECYPEPARPDRL